MTATGHTTGEHADLNGAFAATMAGVPGLSASTAGGSPLALAVSGGPDSMALAVLMRDWAAEQTATPRLSGLIVDHGLRPESATEAETVATRLRALGIAPHILRWEGKKPGSAVQATARDARYRLMLQWCRDRGADALFLGHHSDDQAATVRMRLERGSGLDGLAGMRPVTARDGVMICRPLLQMPKTALVALLQARQIAWVEDPSNTDERFERNRIDQVLRDAGPVAVARLLRLGRRAARAVDALNRWAATCWDDLATVDAECRVTLAAGFADLPEELRLRLLIRAATSAGGQEPALAAAEGALALLDAGQGATLGRAVVRFRGGRLVLTREHRNLPDMAWPNGGTALDWDGRFLLRATRPVHDRLRVAPDARTLPSLQGADIETTGAGNWQLPDGNRIERHCLACSPGSRIRL